MELTPEIIIMVITSIITGVFGILAKKFNWTSKEIIPFQNLAIGLFAGIFLYLTNLNTNLISAVFLSYFSAMGAGGTYDLFKMKNEENVDKVEEKIENKEEEK